MKSVLGVVLGVLGWLCVALAFLSGVGCAIYNYAHDIALAMSLWEGFCLWAKMLGGGLLSLFVGWLLLEMDK